MADERPTVGDMVRLNGFCSPQNLYPIPVHRLFEVDDVDGDCVILKYTTEEDWECVFQVHRFCVISAVRHQRALQQYQDKILEVRACEKRNMKVGARSERRELARIPRRLAPYVPSEAKTSIGTSLRSALHEQLAFSSLTLL